MRGLKTGAAVVVAALALVGCSQSEENSQNAVSSGGTFQFISPGGQTTIRYDEADRKPLKDFSGEDLRDESTTIKLSDFKDQIVVLNSWGQWCAPCRSESDDLQAIHAELQKREVGTVLGLSLIHI